MKKVVNNILLISVLLVLSNFSLNATKKYPEGEKQKAKIAKVIALTVNMHIQSFVYYSNQEDREDAMKQMAKRGDLVDQPIWINFLNALKLIIENEYSSRNIELTESMKLSKRPDMIIRILNELNGRLEKLRVDPTIKARVSKYINKLIKKSKAALGMEKHSLNPKVIATTVNMYIQDFLFGDNDQEDREDTMKQMAKRGNLVDQPIWIDFLNMLKLIIENEYFSRNIKLTESMELSKHPDMVIKILNELNGILEELRANTTIKARVSKYINKLIKKSKAKIDKIEEEE